MSDRALKAHQTTHIEVNLIKVPVGLEDNVHIVQACNLDRRLSVKMSIRICSAKAYIFVASDVV